MNDMHTCSSGTCCQDEGSEKKCCGNGCSSEGHEHSEKCKEGASSCCKNNDDESKSCCHGE